MTGGRSQKPRFNFSAVFEPDDYLYFYSASLTNSRTAQEINFLIDKLGLDAPKQILDLACGYGRHSVGLAELGHKLVGVDITPGF